MVIGHNFIGGSRSAQGTTLLKSIHATTGEALPYEFHHATEQEVNQACEAASQAFKTYRHTSPEQRAIFLENIADELDALGTDFLEIVSQETALPLARLQGERARTSGQMRLFAKVLRRGDFLGARIDTALPERQPLPRPDLRQIKIGVGPVAVFGASNFPLAFSTAGGDTASALAAGCSVVVKAHSGHMATADFVAQAIERAVEKSNMPKGVFNMIYGNGVGEPLVKHPLIQAVGFTGSLRGGRALCDMAAARPQPIPVFAEMSSINPMLMLPEALKNRGEKIAQDLADSVVLGCGQFCTNPGLILGIKSAEFSQLISNLTEINLTEFADVVPVLEEKAGRLLINGYPTGVEVCDAMVHGGPYPATSDARGTSVGTLAIDRYLRPVCYQNYPQNLLPEALKDSNPLQILRLVNGEMTREAI
ncbi:Aldehyde dehydrogenase [Acinetobacter baumannii]|uniref:aldehyde dehydrogenase (NADP(+)) n=1 Tax=Acinetobacter baumannii TaxID=470 RepID=UPI001360AC98|nr:aldehyde dehydrogenase (NADP(+)) [Acinetobacter baumannii]CAA0235489.1 Aldehyde dehydrogenase [Acinetobacter baumannii]